MLWLVACAAPDPDALLRAHDLDGAAEAWARSHESSLDPRYPASDVLSRRAARDPTITTALVVETVDALKLLDAAPQVGLKNMDLPLERLSDLAVCTPTMLRSPWLVAIGRSDTPADADPYEGGPLQWKRGRLVGFASTADAITRLYAAVDKDPPPRLTTVAVRADASTFFLFLGRRDGGWTLATTTDVDAATRYLLGCKQPVAP